MLNSKSVQFMVIQCKYIRGSIHYNNDRYSIFQTKYIDTYYLQSSAFIFVKHSTYIQGLIYYSLITISVSLYLHKMVISVTWGVSRLIRPDPLAGPGLLLVGYEWGETGPGWRHQATLCRYIVVICFYRPSPRCDDSSQHWLSSSPGQTEPRDAMLVSTDVIKECSPLHIAPGGNWYRDV